MTEIETLTPIVARIMRIDDITAGDPQKDYLARYRGQIYGDSAEAYDRLIWHGPGHFRLGDLGAMWHSYQMYMQDLYARSHNKPTGK